MSNSKTNYLSVIMVIIAAGVTSFMPLPVLDADEEQKNPIQQRSAAQNQIAAPSLKTPLYTPPQKENRTGTFARTARLGTDSDLATLSVLAPNHVGLTVKEQPTLYWHLSNPMNNRIEFGITQNQIIQPLLKTHLKVRPQTGIQTIRLADYGIRLLPGKQYQWYIKIVQETENETKNNIVRGMIRRIKPDQALSAQIEKSETSTVPIIYAQEGIWYDAIETLATLIDTSPSSIKEREQFSSLLTGVGLLEVAEYVTKSETTLIAQKKVLTKGENNAKKRKFAVPVNMPVYKPPMFGAASNLVGGGTRGTRTDMGTISAIAPINVGLTTKEQPSLFWYLSETTTSRIDFILNDPEVISPLLEITLETNIKPGVHRLNLADYGAHLSSGKQYQWFVAQVTDPTHRSKDIITGGLIERREPPEALLAKLSKAGKTTMHHVYASEGIWYDAFSAISDLIAQAPDDSELRKQRSSLLEQVGLSKIAAQDMNGM
ncbi:MAG: hypothetical protein SCALA701_14820 [Candidatus Scalindua sp.]|nr:DUF928 domain-containing protein [Planctomycetota bacterium]GJQ58681.1 MAG: hypothetical protein SCALA701_14820 [Candidatus Scalindua sp.]